MGEEREGTKKGALPIRVVRGYLEQIRTTGRCFLDPEVPIGAKVGGLGLLALAVGYLVFPTLPVDLIPDFLPVAGQVDDLAVIFAAMKSFELFARHATVGGKEEEQEE